MYAKCKNMYTKCILKILQYTVKYLSRKKIPEQDLYLLILYLIQVVHKSILSCKFD